MKNRKVLFVLGRPFSPFYGMLMSLRAFMYRVGLLRITRLDVPVISVGNITLGGSGKTPVVQYIARLLKSCGWRPAVVSRGYGGSSKKKVNIVSSGGEPLLDANYIGDEPRLHAEALDGIPVLTGPVRRYPAKKAVELGADIVVLDDGFQHMALGRTIDLVLFNTDKLAGNSRVFPGGDLREPIKALRRCDGFILTGTSERNRERAESFAGLLTNRFPGCPVFIAHYTPKEIVGYSRDGKPVKLKYGRTADMTFYGFSGIAYPENFAQTLQEMGIHVAGFKAFPDHYSYSPNDIRDLVRFSDQAGSSALITTQKDLVKVKGIATSISMYAVRMEAELGDDFHDFLRERLPDKA